MATRFSIEAVFRAIDRMTAPIQKMTIQNKKFMRTLKTDFASAQRSVQRFGENFKNNFTRIIKTGAMIGAGALAVGLGIATKQFIDFDHAVTMASAKFKDLNLSTIEGQKTLEELRKTARKVGAETQFTATQAAQGLDFLAMAGFNTQQAMVSLRPTVDLATAGNVDLARATDIASDSLGAFGLMTEDTNQLQKSFIRLNDVMAKTMTSTNTNLEMMFDAIKKGAPTFTATGQSLESFNALLGILAGSGVKGSEAGTQLRNIMLRLANPAKDAKSVLNDLGIVTKDSAGNFLDVVDILEQFEKATKDMGTAQKASALSIVFGKRAVTGINVLLQSGTENIKKFRNELMNSAGASQQMAEIMRKSLQNRIKILQSAALELGFKFIEAFEKHGGEALDKLTKYVQQFNPEPIIKGIKNVINIAIKLIKILKFMSPVILILIAAFAAYKITMIIAAIATSLFGAALNTLPIFAIITAIALLVIGILWLIKNWDKVKKVIIDFSKKAIKWLKDFVDKSREFFDKFSGFGLLISAPFTLVLSTIKSVVEHMEDIKKAFKEEGIIGGILAIGKAILDGMLIPIQSFLELVSKIPGVGDLATKGAEKIAELRESLFRASKGEVTSPITPAERSQLIREESVSRGEVVITDETGKAQMKKQAKGNNIKLKLQTSGGFH